MNDAERTIIESLGVYLPPKEVTTNDIVKGCATRLLLPLERLTGKETLDRIEFKPDPAINKLVSTWPGAVDNTRALQMGFRVDSHFDEFITQFIAKPL